MGYRENAERDRKAKEAVQRLRDQRDAQTRADWLTSETKHNLDRINANHAARKAAQSGSCMMARTTVALLGLTVVVLNAMARDSDTNCDGSEKPWKVLHPQKPDTSPCGTGARSEGGAPRESPGCNG